MDVRIEKESFIALFDTYGALLTATRREICSLYLEYDLSLGEIAEQKAVAKQSVSDCLQKAYAKLKDYDEKLGVLALKRRLAELVEYRECAETIKTAKATKTAKKAEKATEV